MEVFGFFGVLLVAVCVLLVAAAALALPVLWVWMLVDSLMRDESCYPGAGVNEKLIWVLAIIFVQPVAIVYFFVVYRTQCCKAVAQ